jgi:pimeloyl-ACP methyl ester carboxylesterase
LQAIDGSSSAGIGVVRETRLNLDNLDVHMIEAGPMGGPSFLFLHGWPQSSYAFTKVMDALASEYRVAAIDLPGIGRSVGRPRSPDKRTLAHHVKETIANAGLSDVTLVGHDVGGQIAYAFLRRFPESAARVAILDVVIPGIPPWSEVIRNPQIWHFGFHAVPNLPELLVSGRQRAYFDFFFNAIAANPGAIAPEARAIYAAAYSSEQSLGTGFDWYRAFAQDARDNMDGAGSTVNTPVLYIRGDKESGTLQSYLDGLRGAGLHNATGEIIADCGHFSPEEQPEALAAVLRHFAQNS